MRWELGSVTVVRVVDQAFGLPVDAALPGWCVPDYADDQRGVDIAFSAFALGVGDRRIVVDPWLADDGPRQRPDAAEHVAALLDQLADGGFPADAVDTVFNTHLDGIGWNTRPSARGEAWVPSFPNARYRWSAEQLARHAGDDRLAPLLAADVVDPVADGEELAPGVVVMPAPGHEPGHLALRIADGDRLAIIAGHLFISPLQVADPTLALDEDAELAAATRRALLADLAAHDGLLLAPLMGAPGGGKVHQSQDGSYELEAATG